ncbi:unnamed protein product [Phytomonas sp. Hart1]|nr:unnamed protein product [Phytomonas sp. Hart1]|eukprot:CCW70511.1 unnamed protein product [Phytomonas sp. isolate Hart1]
MSNPKKPNTPHQFWNQQPVPQSPDDTHTTGPMDRPKTVDEIPTEPYPIASTFEWWVPNPQDPQELQAVYELLRDNYVEDEDSMFRFNYSKEFLNWALTPPGYVLDWLVGVRRKHDKKLLAFISGVPITVKMGVPTSLHETTIQKAEADGTAVELYEKPRRICEINFLCVHKQLREKHLTPILIKEITRRVNRMDIWQAIYTTGVTLPTPFSSSQYYHRSLNPEKLVAIKFSGIGPQYQRFQNPMAVLKRLLQLPAEPRTKHLREMQPSDVPQVAKLLQANLDRFDVAPVFNEEEVLHYLTPRDDIVFTYVICHNGEVTDFFSFYSLPSTIIGNSKYNLLRIAYIFYYVATTVPLQQLILDLLIIAKKKEYDVCNMVDILDNRSFAEQLKFSQGDGQLHYYFYNWAYPKRQSSDIGLVML